MKLQQTPARDRRKRGFERASGLLGARIRKVSESRGFAVTRLLTHWPEIVGPQTAETALPVKISYGRGGFGATLTVLTTGANAPMLQAELPKILDAVNRCYGYAAVSRIRITQTAETGFAEGQVEFVQKAAPSTDHPDQETLDRASKLAQPVQDDSLRTALELLGTKIVSKTKSQR